MTATSTSPVAASPSCSQCSSRSRWPATIVAAFLAIHVALVIRGDFLHAPNLMEAVDLPAGIHHLETGTFRLRSVNPPLIRMIAAIPVRYAGAVTDWRGLDDDANLRPEFVVGHDFIAANGERVFYLFALARLACIPFTILGCLVCSLWARDLSGPWGGVAAAGLWCFDPTILGHAETMNSDVPAAAMAITAAYGFSQWLDRSTWPAAIAEGFVLGAALLTRTTLWILLPVFVVAAVFRSRGREARTQYAAQLAVVFTLAVAVVNLAYGFEGTLRILGNYSFVSTTFGGSGASLESRSNRWQESLFARLPVPLPAAFVEGVDLQRFDLENCDGRFRSYLRGEWSRTGWWYYYLYGFAVKWPLGAWGLLLLSVALRVRALLRGDSARSGESLCLSCGLAILLLVSSQTGFSIHFRYVLPAFPFFFVWMSRPAAEPSHLLRIATTVFVGLFAASSLAVAPHSMSYFNELAGGPEQGHAHLLHSSIDWGQDLLELRDWIAAHGVADEISLAATGPIPAEMLGIEKGAPPHLRRTADGSLDPASGPAAGWHAISVTSLREPRYEYFLEFEPSARIGYSIYIYHFDNDEVSAYRRRLGFAVQ